MKSRIFCFFVALTMIFSACNKDVPYGDDELGGVKKSPKYTGTWPVAEDLINPDDFSGSLDSWGTKLNGGKVPGFEDVASTTKVQGEYTLFVTGTPTRPMVLVIQHKDGPWVTKITITEPLTLDLTKKPLRAANIYVGYHTVKVVDACGVEIKGMKESVYEGEFLSPTLKDFLAADYDGCLPECEEFVGWFVGKNELDPDAEVTSNLTIKAKSAGECPKTYPVEFYDVDGNLKFTLDVDAGDCINWAHKYIGDAWGEDGEQSIADHWNGGKTWNEFWGIEYNCFVHTGDWLIYDPETGEAETEIFIFIAESAPECRAIEGPTKLIPKVKPWPALPDDVKAITDFIALYEKLEPYADKFTVDSWTAFKEAVDALLEQPYANKCDAETALGLLADAKKAKKKLQKPTPPVDDDDPDPVLPNCTCSAENTTGSTNPLTITIENVGSKVFEVKNNNKDGDKFDVVLGDKIYKVFANWQNVNNESICFVLEVIDK